MVEIKVVRRIKVSGKKEIASPPISGFRIRRRRNTLMFTGHQFMIQDDESKLQLAIHKLHELSSEYNTTTLAQKIKVMDL